jgi:hypothetical protein
MRLLSFGSANPARLRGPSRHASTVTPPGTGERVRGCNFYLPDIIRRTIQTHLKVPMPVTVATLGDPLGSRRVAFITTDFPFYVFV